MTDSGDPRRSKAASGEPKARLTPEAAARLAAAHEACLTALRELYRLRRDRGLSTSDSTPPISVSEIDDAQRRVKETFAEWVMLFEHETGTKHASRFSSQDPLDLLPSASSRRNSAETD